MSRMHGTTKKLTNNNVNLWDMPVIKTYCGFLWIRMHEEGVTGSKRQDVCFTETLAYYENICPCCANVAGKLL